MAHPFSKTKTHRPRYMKFHIAIVLLAMSCGIIHAQFNWMNTGGPDGSLKSYLLSNDQYAFIPEYDFLYRTADGIHWEAIEHVVSGRMSIYKDTLVNIFYDRETSIGHMQLSYDNGTTWVVKEIPNELDDAYADIVICSHGIYIYLLTSNLLYHSADLGDSWDIIPHQGIEGINMFTFENRLYILNDKFLARTDTVGKNWSIITPPLMQYHIIADVVATGHHVLVQTAGTGNDQLFLSHDDAQTWESQPMKGSLENDNIQEVGNSIFAFSNQYFFLSEDYGISWDTLQEIGISLAPYYFTGLKDTFLFTTFDSGVFRWDDSTKSIKESDTGLSKGYIYDLCTNGDHIWASTGNGVYVYSITSKTWVKTSALPNAYLRYPFLSVSQSNNILLASNSQLDFYISQDGGMTWQLKSIPPEFLGIFWIQFIGPYIYVITDFGVTRSADLGETWDYPFAEEFMISNITYFHGKYYMADVGHLYSSADDGDSWQSSDIAFDIYGLGSFGEELFAVAINNGVKELYISSDGSSWHFAGDGFPQDYPTDLFRRNKPLFFRDAENYYVFNADMYYQIYTTPADNVSWNILPFTKPLQPGEHPYDCVFYNDIIYLGGQGMYSTEVENPIVSTNKGFFEYPYSLINASPNPTKDFIMIHVPDTEIEDKLILSLYDSRGCFVKSQLSTNTANIRMEVDKLPSGMYFLKLLTGDQAGMIKVIKN